MPGPQSEPTSGPTDEDGPLFVIGVTSGDPVWAVACIAACIVGTALVLFAVARHWAFGRQWAAILGVLLFQCVLMFAFWKGH